MTLYVCCSVYEYIHYIFINKKLLGKKSMWATCKCGMAKALVFMTKLEGANLEQNWKLRVRKVIGNHSSKFRPKRFSG